MEKRVLATEIPKIPVQHYEHHFQSAPSLPSFHMENIRKGVSNSSHRRTIMEIPILKNMPLEFGLHFMVPMMVFRKQRLWPP
jgi:hypothetical protein